jgi:hypothetical protein
MSIQRTTQELRDSVNSVTSIPQDMVQSVVKAAELDDTIDELKGVADSVGDMGKTLDSAGKVIKDPVGAAVSTARDALKPPEAADAGEVALDAAPEAEAEDMAEASAGEEGIAARDEPVANKAGSAAEAVPFAPDGPEPSGERASQDPSLPEDLEVATPSSTEEEMASEGDVQESSDE